jgi:hypothetical protein
MRRRWLSCGSDAVSRRRPARPGSGGGTRAVALALLPSLSLPLGRHLDADDAIPTASRRATIGLALAASGHVGRVALNGDAGYTHALGSRDDREGYRGTLAVDAALGFQATGALQPALELGWARDRVEDGPSPWALTLTAGLQYALPAGRLGLGVQRVVDGALVDITTVLLVGFAITIDP